VSFRRDRIGLTDRGETGREGKEGVAASTTSSGSASPSAEEETKQGFTPSVPERKWSADDMWVRVRGGGVLVYLI
jgi:hypothetical protein